MNRHARRAAASHARTLVVTGKGAEALQHRCSEVEAGWRVDKVRLDGPDLWSILGIDRHDYDEQTRFEIDATDTKMGAEGRAKFVAALRASIPVSVAEKY